MNLFKLAFVGSQICEKIDLIRNVLSGFNFGPLVCSSTKARLRSKLSPPLPSLYPKSILKLNLIKILSDKPKF